MNSNDIQSDTIPFRFVKQYFNILYIVLVLHGPVMVIGSSTGIRSVFILSILLIYLSLDLSLIFSNLNKISLNIFEVSLLTLLICSIFIGIYNSTSIDRRYVTDFLMPLTFIFKISLSRKFFAIPKYFNYFQEVFLKKIIWGTFISSIVTLVFFYILLQFKAMYLGLTPIVYPMLIYGMMSKKNLLMVISILVIFLSGKRSMLLGTIMMFLIYYLILNPNKIKSIAILAVAILSIIVLINSEKVNESRAFRKYKWTFEKLKQVKDDPMIIDIITGGRLAEIQGIDRVMSRQDYILGKGVGFTYTLDSKSYGRREKHGNAHFTPLSIISKYGLFFYIIVMMYIFYSLYKARGRVRRKEKNSIFLFLFIIGINIDFLFAYGFFTNKLFPFAMGFLNTKRVKRQSTP